MVGMVQESREERRPCWCIHPEPRYFIEVKPTFILLRISIAHACSATRFDDASFVEDKSLLISSVTLKIGQWACLHVLSTLYFGIGMCGFCKCLIKISL